MNFFNGCNSGFGGCNNNGCGGCDACSLLTWIILLQCLCGNGNNGCGMDICTLIILLMLCGCCGNSYACK